MSDQPDVHEVAAGVIRGLGMLMRRLRQAPAKSDPSIPEISALARLDRGGPMTSAALARQEGISPQSMGATLAALEARGLVEGHPDPRDGRCTMLSPTEAGLETLQQRRNERTERLAEALRESFTADELSILQQAAPLIQRLADGV